MDKAVSVAFDIVEILDDFRRLRPEEKYRRIRDIRERY